MADQLFVGIDSGTQGTKGVVFSRDTGQVVAQAYRGYSLVETKQGAREQHPAIWINACEEILAELAQCAEVESRNIAAIGISGQQHGMVALDSHDSVIRPAKLWCDTETVKECAQITEKLGGQGAVIEAIGNQMAVGFTASKILWLKQNEPENYESVRTILLPHDYINFWLTGRKCTEAGDASGTAYYDIVNRCWSDTVLQAIDPSRDLRQCLPELVSPSESVGRLRGELAERFGFSKDVIISSGGGDNMMAAIGTGNVRPGTVTASLGTSGTIYSYSDRPIVDQRGELASFCSSSGGWLPLICTMNVTVATEQVRNLLGLRVEEMSQLAGSVAPGAEGLLLLPYFNGERTPPLPTATATLTGIDTLNMRPETMCRAAMEGATLGLRYGLDILQENGVEPEEIRLVGGGAKNDVWCQIIADIFGCQIVCLEQEEAGATGAALQALWCYENFCGNRTAIFEVTDKYVRVKESTRREPDGANGAFYTDLYSRYRDLNKTMTETYT